MKRIKDNHPILLFIWILLGFGLYAGGMSGQYFADDFKYVFDSPSTKIFHFFFNNNPNAAFYRPIESMVLAVIQSLFGLSTFPIHSIIVFCHGILSYCVYLATIRLGFSRTQAGVSGAIMLVSQANALAVLSNDTLSQVGGTLFGFCSLWYFYQVIQRGSTAETDRSVRRQHGMSILFFIVSLWMKETSLSFILAFLVLLFFPASSTLRSSLRVNVRRLVPYLIVALVYISIRSLVVTGLADERYTISLGLNVVRNTLLTVFSAFLPASSVSVYSAMKEGDLLFVGVAGTLTFVMMISAIIGMFKAAHPSIAKVLMMLSITTMFPVILFQHVSELYVYNTMPLVSMIIGIGVVSVVQRWFQKSWLQSGVLILFIAFCLSHVVAIQQKSRLMNMNGRSASVLLEKIVPFVHSVPQGGTLILRNPPSDRPEYSVFLMNGFSVLEYGTNIVRSVSGRNDIQVWVVNDREYRELSNQQPQFVLRLVDGEVRAEGMSVKEENTATHQ